MGLRTTTTFLLLICSVSVLSAPTKHSAVDKVVELLTNLNAKIEREGLDDARSYDKFGFWCKKHETEMATTHTELNQDYTDSQADLTASQTAANGFDTVVGQKLAVIESTRTTLEDTLKRIQGDLESHKSQMEDYQERIDKCRTAYKVVAAKSFLQVERSREVQEVVKQAREHLADSKHAGARQDDDAQVQDVVQKFCTQLRDQWQTHKTNFETSKAEESLEREKAKQIIVLNEHRVADQKARSAEARTKAAEASAKLTAANSEILALTALMTATNRECVDAASDYKARSDARLLEITTLSAVLKILTSSAMKKGVAASVRLNQNKMTVKIAQVLAQSPAFMKKIESGSEALGRDVAAPSFFTVSSQQGDNAPPASRKGSSAASILLEDGKALKSSLLISTAHMMTESGRSDAGPLDRMKTLLEDLLQRLLSETSTQDNQAEFCKSSMEKAEERRASTARNVDQLNQELEDNEVYRASLLKSINELRTQKSDLQIQAGDALTEFNDNKNMLTQNKNDADTALAALIQAEQAMANYTSAAAQTQHQGGMEEGGIVGMLQIVRSDFERTVQMAQDELASSQRDYDEFKAKSDTAIAAIDSDTTEKGNERASARTEYTNVKTKLISMQEAHVAVLKQIASLQATCVNSGMTFEERAARREDEIASLKKALCVLESPTDNSSDC